MPSQTNDLATTTVTVKDLITWAVVLVAAVSAILAGHTRVAVLETKQAATEKILEQMRESKQIEASQMADFRKEMQESNRRQSELLEKLANQK